MNRVVLLCLVILMLSACSATAATSTSTPERPEDCARWDEIDPSKIGEAMCVYGRVADIKTIDNGEIRIYFSTQSGTLFLGSENQFPDLEVGDCIWVTNVLRAFGNMRYMIFEDLSYC